MKTFAHKMNLRVLWLTRTTSQIQHIYAEIGAETGALLPVYGRRTLCLHEAVSQVEQRRFNSACIATRMAGRCPHYPGRPKAVKSCSVGSLKEHGRRLMTCPYEIQILSIQNKEALVAAHRQLSVISWLLSKWRWSKQRTLLVIDEAQHVLRGVLEMARDTITLTTLKKAAKEANRYGFRDISNKLSEAYDRYLKILGKDGEEEVDDLLPSVEDLEDAGTEIQIMKLQDNLVPASHLLSLVDFKLSLAGQKPLLVREGERVFLEATADPRELLRLFFDGWRAVVIMTATLDAELVERLTGSEVTLLRAGWPFEDNLRVYVVTGVTSRYPQRDERFYADITWLIKVFPAGKMLVFVPSYEVLSEIATRCDGDILCEKPGMSQEDVEAMVAEYSSRDDGKALLVYGGRLSEGVNLHANIVLMIGVPFARPTPRSKKLLKTLKSYGFDDEGAWLHGVALPALFSAVQAAGRAVRGPEDRAIVLMCDDRYRRLVRFLPRWFKERVVKTVSLSDVPILLEE